MRFWYLSNFQEMKAQVKVVFFVCSQGPKFSPIPNGI